MAERETGSDGPSGGDEPTLGPERDRPDPEAPTAYGSAPGWRRPARHPAALGPGSGAGQPADPGQPTYPGHPGYPVQPGYAYGPPGYPPPPFGAPNFGTAPAGPVVGYGPGQGIGGAAGYPGAAGYGPGGTVVVKGPRPWPVAAAGYTMLGLGALSIVTAVAQLVGLARIHSRFIERARLTDADPDLISAVGNAVRIVLVLSATFTVLFGLGVAALAMSVLRGNRTSRIVTWVLVGLAAICSCCSIGNLVGGSTNITVNGTGNDRAAEQLANAWKDAIPGWYSGLSGGLSVLQTLGYIAVAILLALPAAHQFFARPTPPPQTWPPPPM